MYTTKLYKCTLYVVVYVRMYTCVCDIRMYISCMYCILAVHMHTVGTQYGNSGPPVSLERDSAQCCISNSKKAYKSPNVLYLRMYVCTWMGYF